MLWYGISKRASYKPCSVAASSLPAGMGVRSDDGALLATAAGALEILDGKDASVLYTLPGPIPLGAPVLAFRPDAKELASGGADGIVRLWDLVSKKQIAALDINPPKRTLEGPGGLQIQDPATLFSTLITTLAFSRDGRLLVGTGANTDSGNHIWVWDAGSGREVRHLQAGSAFISALGVDRAGRRIATGTAEGGIQIGTSPAARRHPCAGTRAASLPYCSIPAAENSSAQRGTDRSRFTI